MHQFESANWLFSLSIMCHPLIPKFFGVLKEILFSDLGTCMATCAYILIFLPLQMAALVSFFTKLKVISSGNLPSINRMKCVHEHVLIE